MTPDPLRCRYESCPEGHPIALEGLMSSAEDERITCPTCREDMALPPIDDDNREWVTLSEACGEPDGKPCTVPNCPWCHANPTA